MTVNTANFTEQGGSNTVIGGTLTVSATGSIVNAPVALTAATVAASSLQPGKVHTLNRAAGIVTTLPAASGTGNTYGFHVLTAVTSNAYVVQVANSTDVMQGHGQIIGATFGKFATAASSDTATLNGSTTGGLAGSYIEVQDVAAGFWRVLARGNGSGSPATPFSAAV